MPSVAYQDWLTVRLPALDAVEAARRVIGGSPRVRRLSTQLVNRSYVVALAAEFQGFCKALHEECARHLSSLTPVSFQGVVLNQFMAQRLLDRGNPNPGNIGADFNRLGLNLFTQAVAVDPRASGWRDQLDELNLWRNAIAHSDYDTRRLGGTIRLTVVRVRGWREGCDRLAELFDRILGSYLLARTGVPAW